MSNWVIWAAVNKAKAVVGLMKKQLLEQPVIHADETVVQVLHEPNRKAKTDSRMRLLGTCKKKVCGGITHRQGTSFNINGC